ncbi:hypothetical protein A6302_02429 [Methylobrevis pamukkalensis]|uniref:Tim44-like domain protein n=1 Tax=Methylobrevis pamukkalensis TaxID=1439726 RepID=A0A1E3H399_9HYPH|nr:hypothetical protein A6302_02429 [Methylobrevis pamukkalensis]
MNGFMDLTSLIFLVIAVAVFWRLRSVLGSRTGTERPPAEPFKRREERAQADEASEGNDNVVALPTAVRSRMPADAEARQRIDAVAPAGSALNSALRMILSADQTFDPAHFVTGAKAPTR